MSWVNILKDDEFHVNCPRCGAKNPINREYPDLDEEGIHLKNPCVKCGSLIPYNPDRNDER
jgi:ribosomal protein L40E